MKDNLNEVLEEYFPTPEQKEAASLFLMKLSSMFATRANELNHSIDISNEMGFNMLSQKGMVEALRWVCEHNLVPLAYALAPHLVESALQKRTEDDLP